MISNLFQFHFKKHFVRLRFTTYFIFGQYGRVLEYCRRLSVFSKKLEYKIFSDFFVEKYILKSAEKILQKKSIDYKIWPDCNDAKKPKIAILGTSIADNGGHTECIVRFVATFEKEYEISLFLNNSYGDSRQAAPEKFKYLSDRVTIHTPDFINYEKSLIESLICIKEYNPDVVFVYSHVLDSISVALLGIINRYGRAKIIFYNHGDHLISLGKCFANLIIECRKVGQYLTQKLFGLKNTCILPFQMNGLSRGDVLSDREISLEREKLDIRPDEIISLSGFSAHKIFCDADLSYFMLLKRVLQDEPNFRHIFISNVSVEEKKKISSLFSDTPELLDRIIFLRFVPDFEKYVQVSDFFIDSFPLGSALTHIDVIKYSKPTVIKINNDNQLYSFENYLYDNYELACHTTEEMYTKIIKLIRNGNYRRCIGEKVYNYYVDHYDQAKIADNYRNFIENRNNLEIFYKPLNKNETFNVGATL